MNRLTRASKDNTPNLLRHLLSNIAATIALFSVVPGAMFSSGLQAEIAVLNPIKDNTIFAGSKGGGNPEDYTLNSCGAGLNLFSGLTNDSFPRRALVKFDIAGSLPAGSTINSATLTIDINKERDSQNRIYSLAPVLVDWGEGTVLCEDNKGEGGRGAPANTGDATWLDAMYTVVNWSAAGGDYAGVSATASIPETGAGTWNSADAGNSGMVTDIASWLSTPANNHGWIIIGDETAASSARRFSSREGAVPPQLTIDYTPPAGAEACCFTNGDCGVLSPAECSSQGGSPGPGGELTCGPNPCPQPVGACCNADNSCSDPVARDTCETAGGTFQGDASTCAMVSCGLEPYVDALPIPGVLAPVGTRVDGAPKYEVSVSEVQQQLHRDLPATTVWGYEGLYPGPTIEADSGQPIEVKYINNLPPGEHYLDVDNCAHGPNYWDNSPRTVTHLHGGHVPSRYDGQPEYDFLPGEFDIYEYPNNQESATLWYHDHALGITRLNVYMGMAGYYLIRDAYESALTLPAGEYEIPLVIQDRQFNPDGSLYYPPQLQNQFLGDTAMANGKVTPYLNVKQGKYRLRIVNGSQARVYDWRLENQDNPGEVIPFNLIGTDGGLIDAPIPLNTINAAPAERFDVVIDFASFPAGTEILLKNDNASTPALPNIMKFIVTGDTGHTAALPGTLRTVTPIAEGSAAGTRRFELEKVAEACAGNEWLVKSLDAGGAVIGEHWDDITEFPILGDTEIWQFENPSTSMHPMHVHLVFFQVLDKVDLTTGSPIPLQPWEINTWKDTVQVPPNTKVRVIMKFEDYAGKFPYHCHLLDHEDHEMMRQFQTTYDPANCNNDGTCDIGEDCISCPADCGEVSGAVCGNGLCEMGDGENCATCPADCAGNQGSGQKWCCGFDDGIVNTPIGCGDNGSGEFCIDATQNRFCREMPRVQACCGDALCEGAESDLSCGADCSDNDADGAPDIIDSDDDNDGVPDSVENDLGTNAFLVDTDGDGVSDYDELNRDGDSTNYTRGIDTDPGSDPNTGIDELVIDPKDTDGDGQTDDVDPYPALVIHTIPVPAWMLIAIGIFLAFIGIRLSGIDLRKQFSF